MDKAVAEKMVFSMKKLFKKGRQLQMRYCANFGDLRVLRLINHHYPDGALASQLAERMDVSMPTMSGKLTSLEKQGLIQRRQSDSDRRKVYITVTEAGQRLIRENYREYIESVQRAAEKLGEEKTVTLCNIMEELSDYLSYELREREMNDAVKPTDQNFDVTR